MTLKTNAPIDPNYQKGLIAADEITGEAFAVQGTGTDGAINVNVTGGGGGGDVNLIEVGGSPIALGQTTESDSLPVTIASDQTPLETQEQTGLLPVVYDAVIYTATSSTVDTYEYYTGGTGGTLQATVTVTWTDSSKNVLVSVVRT